MLRCLVLITLNLVASAALWAQTASQYELTGQVRTVHYSGEKVEIRNGNRTPIPMGSMDVEFDHEGTLVSASDYDPDGKLITRRTVQRQNAESVTTIADLPNAKPWKLIERFDDQGDPVETFQVDGNKVTQKVVYGRDATGSISGKTIYDQNGNIKSRILFSSDRDGNRHTQDEYDASGNLIERQVWTYDPGSDAETFEVFQGGVVEMRSTYLRHNEMAHTERSTQRNPDGTLDDVVTRHDDSGRKVEELVARTGDSDKSVGWGSTRQPGRTTWRYDERGRIVHEQHFDPQGKVIEQTQTSYQDDVRGNWTRKVETQSANAVPLSVVTTTREITYF